MKFLTQKEKCVYKKEKDNPSTTERSQGFTFFLQIDGINWEGNDKTKQ